MDLLPLTRHQRSPVDIAIVGAQYAAPKGRPINDVDFDTTPECLDALSSVPIKVENVFYTHPIGSELAEADDMFFNSIREVADRRRFEVAPMPERSVRLLPALLTFDTAATLLAMTPDALRKRQRAGKLTTMRSEHGARMLSGLEVAELRRAGLEKLDAVEKDDAEMIPGFVDYLELSSGAPILRTRDPRRFACALIFLQ